MINFRNGEERGGVVKFLDGEFGAKVKNAFVIFVGSLLFVVAMNVFIGPTNLYVGGLTGVLQLVVLMVEYRFDIYLSLGLLIFIFNLPILWLGWRQVGKRFVMLTIVVVVLQSLLLEFMPTMKFSSDMLLNAVFGGVLVGLGSGMILKIGASSGGMDVVSQVMAFKFDGSVGKYSFIINIFVILIAGFLQSWEIAMYTIIAMYIASVVVDNVHTIHKNLTVYIVTQKEDEVTQAIWSRLHRGITVLEGAGAYTKKRRSVLMLVLSSYELYEVIEIIKSVDETAFTNVVRSEVVVGNFVKKKLG